MRFFLIDTIESIEKDRALVAVKNVTYSEEYLQDHFPEFPVLPGVFMLEAATQAAAWLLRLSEGFAHSVVILKEARNVKYADFVTPGQQLRVSVELLSKDAREAKFKVSGACGDRGALSGRLTLERYNLRESDPHMQEIDERLEDYFRKWQAALVRPEVLTAAGL